MTALRKSKHERRAIIRRLIGGRLRAERDALKISQRKLAEFLEIDQSTLSKIETGAVNLSAADAVVAAKYLGIRVGRLLGDFSSF